MIKTDEHFSEGDITFKSFCLKTLRYFLVLFVGNRLKKRGHLNFGYKEEKSVLH